MRVGWGSTIAAFFTIRAASGRDLVAILFSQHAIRRGQEGALHSASEAQRLLAVHPPSQTLNGADRFAAAGSRVDAAATAPLLTDN